MVGFAGLLDFGFVAFFGTGLVHMLDMSAIVTLLTFIVFACYGVFAASVRNHLTSRPGILTWMSRTFAGGFAALGLKLALAERS